MYRAMGIHSDLSMDFSPSKCSMQAFFMKPKFGFNMKFSKGKRFSFNKTGTCTCILFCHIRYKCVAIGSINISLKYAAA